MCLHHKYKLHIVSNAQAQISFPSNKDLFSFHYKIKEVEVYFNGLPYQNKMGFWGLLSYEMGSVSYVQVISNDTLTEIQFDSL